MLSISLSENPWIFAKLLLRDIFTRVPVDDFHENPPGFPQKYKAFEEIPLEGSMHRSL